MTIYNLVKVGMNYTKYTLCVLLIMPFMAFTQESESYFEVSKDEFYYDKMSSWKETLYKDLDCEFSTHIDSDSVFSFSAKNYLFKESYQLTLGKEKKITKIEVFFTVHNGKLDDWFPHKYPINISNLFNNLGTPIVSEDNIPFISKYVGEGSEYLFKKYYKWDNTQFLESNIDLEVAIGLAKSLIKNKREKVKKQRTADFGYVSYTPKYTRPLTDFDVNFSVATKISEGAERLWDKNKRELISLFGIEEAESPELLGFSPFALYMENTNDPDEYFSQFYFISKVIYRIEVEDMLREEENRKYTFTSLPEGVIARAVGMDEECCIEILIDLENWNNSTYLDKLFIMYHEFGHDIFGLEHSDGIRLMTTDKLNLEDKPSVLGEMIYEMFFSVLKSQKED